jgi:hypothetical protein
MIGVRAGTCFSLQVHSAALSSYNNHFEKKNGQQVSIFGVYEK